MPCFLIDGNTSLAQANRAVDIIKSEVGDEIEISIGRKALPAFYNQVMPMLSEYIEFVETDKKGIEKFRPVKPDFSFYLDVDGEHITCDAKVKYGEQEEKIMQGFSTKTILDPKYKMPNNYDDLVKVYRTLAKSADQRLVRLESYSHDAGFENIKKWAYANAMHDIKAFSGPDAERFNTAPPTTVFTFGHSAFNNEIVCSIDGTVVVISALNPTRFAPLCFTAFTTSSGGTSLPRSITSKL